MKTLSKTIISKEELVEIMLKNRDIKESDREKFFNPKLSDYEKDLEITGTGKARKRILEAIKNKELIIAYGDYDVDGICGTAILYLGLTSLGLKVLPYIPHREKEGFGLSEEGLTYAKEQGAALIITVDNGISAIEKSKLAKKMGLDLIITDHHLLGEKRPEALSIIHSTKICGAAVGWCLIKSLVQKNVAEDLLDLVALASICDMVPLLGVNRALVKVGLEKIRKTKRIGLKALMAQAKVNPDDISAYHVGYILGPRLNAKGRLEHALDALRLLCTKDPGKAQELAKMLGETNETRKEMVACAVEEAKKMVQASQKIIILNSKQWVPGIVGLIAGRLKEEYGLPAVIISESDNISKGSARSVKGLDIFTLIQKCADTLIDLGGHPGAAGFTIETKKIEIFKKQLIKIIRDIKFDQSGKMEAEAELILDKVGKSWIEELERFEPYGISNPKPVFASREVKISNIKTVGAGVHLKFWADGISSIAFSFGLKAEKLKENQLVDLTYYLEIDKFDGTEKIQLKVKDLELPS